MTVLVNQMFVYALLVAALIGLALLISISPPGILALGGNDRLWLFGFVGLFSVVGYCLGVANMRFLGTHAYAD